jgi:hypothetical protein
LYLSDNVKCKKAVSSVTKLTLQNRGAIFKWLTGVSPAGDEEDKLDIET